MNRTILIVSLIIISSVENLLVNHYDYPVWLGLIISIPVIYGCIIWAREKNRHILWGVVFGAFAPLGLIGMGLLTDKSDVYES